MKGKNLILPILLAALLLAACASPTAEAPAAPNTASEDAAPLVSESPTDAPAAVEPTAGEPAEEAPPAEADTLGGDNVFTIVAAESEARFYIHEIFLGEDKTVLGTAANAVTGQLSVDYANPGAVELGAVTVDATTFITDSTKRTNTLHRGILETEVFPTATFAATGFSGLPDTVTVGETYEFQIMGDLTIHGVTQPVTFDATVTPVSDTRLEGSATLSTIYDDYGIQILRLPREVASVEHAVILEIVFVAEKA